MPQGGGSSMGAGSVSYRKATLNYNTPGWINAALPNVVRLVQGEVVISCGVVILIDFAGTDDVSSDEIIIDSGDGGQLNSGGIAPVTGTNGSMRLSASVMHGNVTANWPEYALSSAASLRVEYAIGTGNTHPTAGSALIWALVGLA